ncbi:hypothetical protein ACIP6V_31690 [Streptomyces sp. NPDC088770]|uniref:hypothetical protein n=1 Tax=Streptomyces sp. NPDC088770 TaxID=3365895 RepID=UPI003823D2CC
MSGRLAPGERSEQEVSWGTGLDAWEVRDTRGEIIGWVVVDTPRRESGAVYNLSDAQPKPGRATPPRVSPHPDPMQ